MKQYELSYTIVDGEHEYGNTILVLADGWDTVAQSATRTIVDDLSLDDEEEAELLPAIQSSINAKPGESGQIGYVEIEGGMRMLTDFTINKKAKS